MRKSLFTYFDDTLRNSPVDDYVRGLLMLREEGFEAAWTVQLPWEQDVLTTLAVAMREVDDMTLGTGVQPIQLRQPMALAQAALTLNLIGRGRFRLGIGLTHALICDGMWGSLGSARSGGSTSTWTACSPCWQVRRPTRPASSIQRGVRSEFQVRARHQSM
jgi:hypothetical protein